MKNFLTSLCLAAAQAAHTAVGLVRNVDAANGHIVITHEAIDRR
ncbi:MAG: hypothetical protein AB1768_03975 [Pseudomonadota bacterium]|jgi:Cu/Ag efflux protein CusF